VYSGTWRLGRTVAVHVDVIRENGGLDAPPRRLLRWRCVGPDGRAALVDEDFSVVIGSADDRGELHTSHIIGSPGRDAGAQLETGTEDLDLTVAACIGPFGERRPIELRTSESILPPGLRWTHAKRRAEIQPWHYRHLATAAGEIDPATVPNGGDTAVALPVLGCAWLERPGFRPIVAPRPRPDLPVEWTPTLPELMGRTILIDPAGGGAEHDGTGPLGTTGSELNLAMARRLADLLRACGARAHLTRDDVRHVPREEKVLQANRLGANLFLTIGRHDDAEGWRLTHHVGSRGGARWAAKVREAAGDLPAEGTVTIGESYAYLLRHTPCAALTCLLPGPIDVAAETRLAAPSHQQSTALAMLRAIAGVFSPDDDPPTALDVRRLLLDYPAHFPAPDDLDLMRINGGLLWLPPRVGEPSAPVPVRGDIVHLEIRSGGDWWLKILEPAAGGGPVITTRLAGIDGLIGPPEAFAPPALEQEDDAR